MIKQYEDELKALKIKMAGAEKFAEKIPCFRDFIIKNKIDGTEDFQKFASYYKEIPFGWGLSRARYISGTPRSISNYRDKHDKYLFNIYINTYSLFYEHEDFGLDRVLEESTVFFFDKYNTTFYVEDEHIEGFLEALNKWYVEAVEKLKQYRANEEIRELEEKLARLKGIE